MKNALKAIGAALGYFVIYTVITSLIKRLFQLFYYISYSDLRISDYEAYSKKAQELIQADSMLIGIIDLVLFLFVMFIIFKVKNINIFNRVRWNAVPKKVYIFIILLAISNITFLNFIMPVLMPQIAQDASDYAAVYTSGGIVFNFLLVVIIGPFVEEFLMRGLMVGRLIGYIPIWVVIAISTLLFGIGHASGGVGQILGTTMTGLIFTLVFIWTNSLRASFLAHAINNLFAAFLPWNKIIYSINTPLQLIICIVSFVATVFVAYSIYKKWDKKIMIM